MPAIPITTGFVIFVHSWVLLNFVSQKHVHFSFTNNELDYGEVMGNKRLRSSSLNLSSSIKLLVPVWPLLRARSKVPTMRRLVSGLGWPPPPPPPLLLYLYIYIYMLKKTPAQIKTKIWIVLPSSLAFVFFDVGLVWWQRSSHNIRIQFSKLGF